MYRWTATGGLFGCFVDCASERLKVRSSNNRIPWSMFEKAFQCEKTTISTAKSAVNSYTMKGLNPPVGYEDIAKICNINFRKKEIEDYNAYIFISVFYILLYSPMYPLYSSYIGAFLSFISDIRSMLNRLRKRCTVI